ncbi:GNAT family N-acetyltransferase [Lentzea sp. NPDC004782]|uniref:GNAT family N-acetyltransferase n=1 Tax=Lentzea sp. NPDC004782 TaxID=3154458 RepID=UPI0033B585F4
MTIRPAVLSDAAAVASVHVRSWQSAYRGLIPDEVLDNLSVDDRTAMWERVIPDGGVWVALDGDDVVGFASAGPSRDDDASFELCAIYSLPSAWGRGLAEPLARAALGDEPDVIVWVLEDNKRARRFYERLGFTADGVAKTQTVGGAVLNELRYRRR